MESIFGGSAKPVGPQQRTSAGEAWKDKAVPSMHEKVDAVFSTNIKDDFDSRKDSVPMQILQEILLNPLSGLGGIEKVAGKAAGALARGAVVTEELALATGAAAELGSGVKIGEILQAHQKTLALGKELGFNTRQMAELKQVGQLEGTIAHAFENIVKNPAMRESVALFKKAETFLEPYSKGFLPEILVLIFYL